MKPLPTNLVAFCRGLALACGAACLAWFAVLLVLLPTMWLVLAAWCSTILLMAWGYHGDLKRKGPVEQSFWYLVVVAAAVWGTSLVEIIIHTWLLPEAAEPYLRSLGVSELTRACGALLTLFLSAFLIFRLTLSRSVWQSTRLVFYSWAVAVFIGFALYTGAMYLYATLPIDIQPDMKHLLKFRMLRSG